MCDNTLVKVWLGLGTNTTWLGLGKDHGLGSNDLLMYCGLG